MTEHEGWKLSKVSIKVDLESSIELDGWVRDADGVGLVFWAGDHPLGWDGYAPGGWLEVRGGAIGETFFARKGSKDRPDPNDPPFWAV